MGKIVKFIKVAAVLIVMACIFYLSSQNATVSRAFSHQVVALLKGYVEEATWLMPSIREAYLSQPTTFTRKAAHFIIYLVLGFVTYLAVPKAWPMKKRILFVLLLCCIYAITDEWHQFFVPGRGPQARDVVIDTLGSSVGMGIGCLIRR